MSIEGVTAELSKAMDDRLLVTIRMHDGSMTEYAQVLEFPNGEGHARVWVQPYRILSGSRLAKRGRRSQLTINKIDYITVHRDKLVPSDDSES
jgi:hypothetical protein